MKWYKHDSNAHGNAKLQRVLLKYGMEGYGLYWYCLELIAETVESHNLSFELEHDAEIIAHLTGIHFERVQEMMTYMVNLGLFERHDGIITCLKLAHRADEYTSKVIRHLPSVPTLSRQAPDKVPPIRREEKRREKKERGRASRCPPTYLPSKEWLADMITETRFTATDISAMLRELKDHEFDKPKKDWDAVFRNWVRRERKWRKDSAGEVTHVPLADHAAQLGIERKPNESDDAFQRRVANADTAQRYETRR